jgi:hypothetical protein
VQGWGGAGLLASYEAERKPIAIRNTSAARALARSVGKTSVPADLEQTTPEGAAERAELGAFLATFGEEFASLGVQLGARYDGSAIIVPDGKAPEDDYKTYRPSSIPGGRTPHIWLDAGRGAGSSLFDHLGVGFTLLQLGPDAVDASTFTEAAARRGVPFGVLHVKQPEALALYGCKLALVRPDQHIAWRGQSVPAGIDRVLAIVVGDDASAMRHFGSEAA